SRFHPDHRCRPKAHHIRIAAPRKFANRVAFVLSSGSLQPHHHERYAQLNREGGLQSRIAMLSLLFRVTLFIIFYLSLSSRRNYDASHYGSIVVAHIPVGPFPGLARAPLDES